MKPDFLEVDRVRKVDNMFAGIVVLVGVEIQVGSLVVCILFGVEILWYIELV